MTLRTLAYRFTLIAHELAMEAWLLTGQLAHQLQPKRWWQRSQKDPRWNAGGYGAMFCDEHRRTLAELREMYGDTPMDLEAGVDPPHKEPPSDVELREVEIQRTDWREVN